MDGITDLGRLERVMARLEGPRAGSDSSLAPASGLVDPQGRPLSSVAPRPTPLSILACVDTPRIAHTRPDIARTYVVGPIVPTGKSTLLVGDSGIGKTPFLYQLGMCVAGSRVFLNMPVQAGPVLYIDWESSREHSSKYQREISTYLGFQKAQDLNFFVHGTWSPWVNSKQDVLARVPALVAELKPILVIFDCIRVLWPNAEKDNGSAQEMWNFHRRLQDEHGCATMAVHHLRKPQVDSKTGREVGVKLQTDPREWLRNSAGTGALLNTCESRIGVALYKGRQDRNKTIVMSGFAKSDGDYDPMVAERVNNEHGKPVGYMVNVQALRDHLTEEQKQLLEMLPASFRNKDAVQLGAGLQMSETKVNNILIALEQAQLLLKDARIFTKL
jgi:hypothetical protein